MSRFQLSTGLFGIVVAALLIAFPALGAQPQDAWITTQVKIKLLTDAEVDALSIDVDTSDGYVTLHGSADSEAAQQHAAKLAAAVEGVRDVRNLIAVVPEAAKDSVQATDEEIRERVENVLERDQALADSDIEVDSVNDGVVVLEGKAETLSAHHRALEDARSVEGVRNVASRIRSPDELADREIWRDATSDPSAASDIGEAASDVWITSKAKVRLMAEPGISPLAVNVDTRNGVVTLFGQVPTEAKKEVAEREVGKISGVKGIENELQVVPDVAAERIEREDDRLEASVRERLEERGALGDGDIDVEVSNGVVRLTGTVNSFGDRMRALTVARTTEGVESVVDGLRVETRKGG